MPEELHYATSQFLVTIMLQTPQPMHLSSLHETRYQKRSATAIPNRSLFSSLEHRQKSSTLHSVQHLLIVLIIMVIPGFHIRPSTSPSSPLLLPTDSQVPSYITILSPTSN